MGKHWPTSKSKSLGSIRKTSGPVVMSCGCGHTAPLVPLTQGPFPTGFGRNMSPAPKPLSAKLITTANTTKIARRLPIPIRLPVSTLLVDRSLSVRGRDLN